MKELTDSAIRRRFELDNPWWQSGETDAFYRDRPRRDLFPAFLHLVKQRAVRRAVILKGPRRVGKTVMLQQTIQELLGDGLDPKRALYLSLDTPLYSQMPLEKLLQLFFESHGHGTSTPCTVVFDEIQYLRDWEVHLKSLHDSYRNVAFIASGSAAAALRLKSRESGAGRFTDFFLPPLTFAEYLGLRKAQVRIAEVDSESGWSPRYVTSDIEALNAQFVDYINFGGYPETALADAVRAESPRYLREDIIDKVLLRDLPNLYGIDDIQELNALFTTLAYNTATELSFEGLAKSSGVAKNTLRRYLEYLEAAFLVRRMRRVDRGARRFQRETAFKIYLANASMRAALFGPVGPDDPEMGRLAETAVFDQWMHAAASLPNLHYARWSGGGDGEIDIVQIARDGRTIYGAVEVKWSDRPMDQPAELSALLTFAHKHDLSGKCVVTTRTATETRVIDGIEILFEPCALYAYRVGLHAAVQTRAMQGNLVL